jgi:hypothetical protein
MPKAHDATRQVPQQFTYRRNHCLFYASVVIAALLAFVFSLFTDAEFKTPFLGITIFLGLGAAYYSIETVAHNPKTLIGKAGI